MEIQLQELIEQIKKDGVEAAEAEAEAIVSSANMQAEKIIADAKAEAEKIIADAKNNNERMIKSGEDAIRQAGRNLLISFRESVAKELAVIVGENIEALYSSDAFAELVVKVVEVWASKPEAESLSVLLNSSEIEKFEDNLLAALKGKISKGITLKPNDNFDGGFRIAVNNSGAYYDYSAEAVTEMLSDYLSPAVTKLLKEAE